MMWMRFIMMGFFSFTAISLLTFQGIEILEAFMQMYKNK